MKEAHLYGEIIRITHDNNYDTPEIVNSWEDLSPGGHPITPMMRKYELWSEHDIN